MSNTKKSSDDKGVFIFLIVISLIYFAHYYAQHGWGYILEHFRSQTINFIRWVVTFIFGIIVIIWGLIPFAMPNSDIKSVKQWILGTALISSFYILVIIFIQTDLLKFWWTHLLLIIPLLISGHFSMLIISEDVFQELGCLFELGVIGVHLLFFYIIIARIYFHFAK